MCPPTRTLDIVCRQASMPTYTELRDTLATLRAEALHYLHNPDDGQKLHDAVAAAHIVFDPVFTGQQIVKKSA